MSNAKGPNAQKSITLNASTLLYRRAQRAAKLDDRSLCAFIRMAVNERADRIIPKEPTNARRKNKPRRRT